MRIRSGVVIVNDNRVLLMHRWGMDQEYFVTPGGGVEEGESIEEAAVRETKEETNLDVTLGEKIFDFSQEIDGYGKPNRIILFLVTEYRGEVQFGLSGPEAAKQSSANRYALEWIPLKHIPNINLVPTEIGEVLKKL